MNRVDSGNNETSFFKATKEKAEEWSKRIIPPKNDKKTRAAFRKAITAALIPASAIKNLVDRIATAINGKSDVINTQKQTTPTQSATNDDAVNAISSIEIITSNDGIEKIKKELTSPGSLVCSDGIANTKIATQTIAIHKLPDKYFENISSFDQLQHLPNIPRIENEITELDKLQEEIISKIKDKITELQSNSIKSDDQINNDQINKLNKLRSDIPNKINQLKDNLTNALNRLKDCTNENDVKDINEQLTSCLIAWQELIKSLSRNRITTSKTTFNVFTGEIQAIRDSKVATNTVSYKNDNDETISLQIQPDGSDFISTMNKTAKAIGTKKSTILKQFLLYPAQAAVGSLSSLNITKQDETIQTTQDFTFEKGGMKVFSTYAFKTYTLSSDNITQLYGDNVITETIEMQINDGDKICKPLKYKIAEKKVEEHSGTNDSIKCTYNTDTISQYKYKEHFVLFDKQTKTTRIRPQGETSFYSFNAEGKEFKQDSGQSTEPIILTDEKTNKKAKSIYDDFMQAKETASLDNISMTENTLVEFDSNHFPKLTNTNAFPGNFPEYLKEPFKQLCEEINNQPQQTQSDPEASEENKTVTETFVQPTWKPGQTGHVKQVERNENRPMAATHREN